MSKRFIYYCTYFTTRTGNRRWSVNIYDTLSSNILTTNDLRFN